MAEAVVLVDPLGVQRLVLLEADGRAVPGDVDPRMRVEEELRLLGGGRSARHRIEEARAELPHLVEGDHRCHHTGKVISSPTPRPREHPGQVCPEVVRHSA